MLEATSARASLLNMSMSTASSTMWCDRDSVLFTLEMLSLHSSPSRQNPVNRRLLFNDSADETHRPLAENNYKKSSGKFRIEVVFSV